MTICHAEEIKLVHKDLIFILLSQFFLIHLLTLTAVDDRTLIANKIFNERDLKNMIMLLRDCYFIL